MPASLSPANNLGPGGAFPGHRAGDDRDKRRRPQIAFLDVVIWVFLIALAFAGLLTSP